MGVELIPVLVIDDTPVKRRGVCEFVEETPQLELFAQAGEPGTSIALIENLCTQKAGENCVALIARGLSNDEIALRMGYLSTSGKPNIGPLENLVSELYSFFAIEGASSDPGRRVMLAHAYEAYSGQRSE